MGLKRTKQFGGAQSAQRRTHVRIASPLLCESFVYLSRSAFGAVVFELRTASTRSERRPHARALIQRKSRPTCTALCAPFEALAQPTDRPTARLLTLTGPISCARNTLPLKIMINCSKIRVEHCVRVTNLSSVFVGHSRRIGSAEPVRTDSTGRNCRNFVHCRCAMALAFSIRPIVLLCLTSGAACAPVLCCVPH